MHDLQNLLGQTEIINQIYDWLLSASKQDRLLVLKGVSGSGKTFITNEVVQFWDTISTVNKSIQAVGDIACVDRPLFPLVLGVDSARHSFFLRETTEKSVSQLTRLIPHAGDFLSYLFDLLADKKINSAKNKLAYLNPQEQEILLSINSYYRSSNLLLIADNFHYWDQSSIDLLNFMLSGVLDEVFSFVQRMKIIVVITEDQVTDSSKENIRKFLIKHQHMVLSTTTLKKEDFEEAFHLMGGEGKIESKTQDLLFSLTGGHLELIKKLATLPTQSKNGEDFLLSLTDPHNEGNDQHAFIEKILITRLQLLGAESVQIIKLLEYAAVIGFSFTYEEILCLVKDGESNIREIISQAKDAALINIESSRNNFSHEIIRQFFACRLGNRKYEYSRNFAECLKILRPSEYFERAGLLFEAGRIKESLALYIVGCLKNIREGLKIPPSAAARIERFAHEHKLLEYYSSMKAAYASFHKGEYLDARKVLEVLEDAYPEVLVAEKYYLLSLCVGKNLNLEDIILAKKYLLDWEKLKNSESEVWVRIMLTLMSRHAHLNEYDEAASIEKKVLAFLINRIQFDKDAEYSINILRRKASILHISEIACKRTSESLAYFGYCDLPGVYRSPIQYFMALTNHSGNLIAAGDFMTANEMAQNSIALQKIYPEIIFPRIEVAINNYVVSGFLSDKLDLDQIIQLYDSLFRGIRNPNDRILLRSNFIIMNALNGQLENALNMSNELWQLLSDSSRKDEYYTYFVGINRAVLFYLAQEKGKAISLLDILTKSVPSIPDKAFLVKRHDLLRGIFQNKENKDPTRWNSYILENYPQQLGPSWAFWGKGFLFTDMQFWSDS